MSPRRSFDEALAAIDGVAGWLSPGQARQLYDAAAVVRPGGQIVEIGSFRGRSTVVIASAIADGVELIAIDPHAGNDRGPQEIAGYESVAATDHEVFLANLDHAGVADRVRHVRAFSDKAHDQVAGSLAMLYVDGAHRYAPARADIRDWGARVDDDGTLLIHDSFSSIGVTLAIVRELVLGKRWRYIGRSRSLAVYRGDLAPSLRARLSNAARQLAQLPWFVRNLLVKVALTLRLGSLLSAVRGRTVDWPY
jgi:predicted O-methyltransferase YrrM